MSPYQRSFTPGTNTSYIDIIVLFIARPHRFVSEQSGTGRDARQNHRTYYWRQKKVKYGLADIFYLLAQAVDQYLAVSPGISGYG